MRNKISVVLDQKLYWIIPILIMFIPLRFLLAWAVAVTCHEFGHICALYLLNIKISSVRIGFRGVVIQTEALSPVTELICASAGPLLGAVLILFSRYAPLVGLCAVFHTVYNLLPLPQHDGERILANSLYLLVPRYAATVITLIQVLFAVLLILLCIRYGAHIPGVYGIVLLILLKAAKIPCKQGKQIVQ